MNRETGERKPCINNCANGLKVQRTIGIREIKCVVGSCGCPPSPTCKLVALSVAPLDRATSTPDHTRDRSHVLSPSLLFSLLLSPLRSSSALSLGWRVHACTSSTLSSTPRARQLSNSAVASAASGSISSLKPSFMQRPPWILSIAIALEVRTFPNHTALPGRTDIRQFCSDSSSWLANVSAAFVTSSWPHKYH